MSTLRNPDSNNKEKERKGGREEGMEGGKGKEGQGKERRRKETQMTPDNKTWPLNSCTKLL